MKASEANKLTKSVSLTTVHMNAIYDTIQRCASLGMYRCYIALSELNIPYCLNNDVKTKLTNLGYTVEYGSYNDELKVDWDIPNA